jgi:hypothetical protein
MKRNLWAVIFLGSLLAGGMLALAQEATPVLPPLAQQTQEAPQVWSPQQLNNLVAPIALYPDPLLGQMLVASTYPLEVVEANQWVQRNKNLSARELMDEAKQQSWDPSVQALVAVPDALAMLNQDIRWTTDLGDAFLAQQDDVMSAVQQMRAQAQAKGRLSSTAQQTVTTANQEGQQVIVIEPANPQVIYVPYYDPFYVWGSPVYGYYPPLYYSGIGFGFGRGFNLSFYFNDWGGWGGWGWCPSWYSRTVFVNYSFFPRYGFHRSYRDDYRGRAVWTHDPDHRLGIPYRNPQVATRYEGASLSSRNSYRAGAGARGDRAAYSNRSTDRYEGRAEEQRNRSTSPQQSYREPRQYRSTAPQNERAQSQRQERYQAPQQYRSVTPQNERNQSQRQERVQAPQQYRSAAPQSQRVQSQPQQRYQSQSQSRAGAQSASREGRGGNSSGGGRHR